MLFVDDPTWKPNFPPILSIDQWSRIAHYLGLPLEDLGLPLEARYNIDNISRPLPATAGRCTIKVIPTSAIS